MAPINPIGTWSCRREFGTRKPKSKYFIICEGSKTEQAYFEALSRSLAEEGIPALSELKPVQRTGEDETNSDPRRLFTYADEIRNEAAFDFDAETDQTVLVLDLDVYRRRPRGSLERDLRDCLGENLLAVTNPSFELYLLLHKENAYRDLVVPNEDQLFENKKEGKRRFSDRLFSEAYGINPKSNAKVGALCKDHEIAEVEERSLNRSLRYAGTRLTSNVGEVIRAMKDERVVQLRSRQQQEAALQPCAQMAQ